MDTGKQAGIFIDYSYINETMTRVFQMTPDPNKVLNILDGMFNGFEGNVVTKKAYANWSNNPEAEAAFRNHDIETVNTIINYSISGSFEPKGFIGHSPATLAWDLAEELLVRKTCDHFIIFAGDSELAETLKRIRERGFTVNIIGFIANITTIMKILPDRFSAVDELFNNRQREILERVVDTFVSLSRKLPYVGYKYFVDILSRNDLRTDYRSMLNQLQTEEVLRLVEVDDPNTIRGKAFAVELVTTHPEISIILEEKGLSDIQFEIPTSVSLRNEDTSIYSMPSSEDHGDPRFLAGKRLVEINQFETAITEFCNYLEEYPNDFLGYVYVISCLAKSGDNTKIKIWCEKALALPNSTRNQREYTRWYNYMKKLISLNATEQFESVNQEEVG